MGVEAEAGAGVGVPEAVVRVGEAGGGVPAATQDGLLGVLGEEESTGTMPAGTLDVVPPEEEKPQAEQQQQQMEEDEDEEEKRAAAAAAAAVVETESGASLEAVAPGLGAALHRARVVIAAGGTGAAPPASETDRTGRPAIPTDLSTETMLGGVGSRERGSEAVAGAGAGSSLSANDSTAVESILQAT